jgi:hypothetical protein
MTEAGRKESARTQPALERAGGATDSGTRARRIAPTLPMATGAATPSTPSSQPPPSSRASSPGLAVPRVLVAGSRPSETASLARSFVDAGALSRVCLAPTELPALLSSTRWTFVMVDVRWEREVREVVQALGHHVPIELYVPSTTLAHRGHVLPLGRADAEELLEAHRATPGA